MRLIGVDTPETVHPSKPVEYMGKAASMFSKLLLQPNDKVFLTYDWNKRDKYGRLLAYIWYKVSYKDKDYYAMHNFVLILNGFGQAYTVFPFKQEYMEKFLAAQRIARENQYGLWGKYNEKEVLELLSKKKIWWIEKQSSKQDSSVSNIKITYIKYSGSDEYIEIKNRGNVAVDLKGWKLYSEGGQWYYFPSITLQPGQFIRIHSGRGATGSFIWTKKYVWNNKGDKAILYDAYGKVVDIYEY